MANITVTNLSSTEDYYLWGFMSNPPAIPPGGSLTLENRSAYEVSEENLMRDKQAGLISVEVEYTSDELNSGLLVPPASVSGDDVGPVAASALLAVSGEIRKAVSAGAGAPDDVQIYAVNTLPFKIRILDVTFLIATAAVGSSWELRTAAAGGGTLISTGDSATTGRKDGQHNNTTVVAPGALVGLFIRRLVDSTGAGEVLIRYRRET